MDYLFSLNRKGSIVLHPDALNLCPEFRVLTNEEAHFMILFCDYASPLHQLQLPKEDILNKAMQMAFGKVDRKLVNKLVIKTAIDAYKGFQYDSRKELMKVYHKKLDALSASLETETGHAAIKNILDSQERLRKSMKDLEDEIMNNREIQATLKGGGTLSFIEKIMRNQEEYKRVTAKRPA